MSSVNTLTVLPSLPDRPPPIPRAAPRSRRVRSRRRPDALAPGVRIGGWRVERQLGSGGMATVYAVVHTQFAKRAALKIAHRTVLGPRFTPETFLREARVVNLIDHAGVACVFATGTYDGRPYLVMERLTGRPLAAQLEQGSLARDEALEILIEVCHVLAAAHTAGITHRDLKIENVFRLDRPGAGGGRTMLLDWGMARISGEDDPMRGLIAGTLTYVAPEQARGEPITPLADVYSLAVLAYRLLFSQPPFSAPNEVDLVGKHLYQAPPRPHALWPAIPVELDRLLVTMLAKRPEDRPPLSEVVRVLGDARHRLRSRLPRWLDPPVSPPIDVMGRPAVPLLATRRQRLAGAAFGLALSIAGLVQLLSA